MSKKNLVLGGVLLALLIVAYIYKGPYQTWKENSSKAANVLSGVVVDNLSKIEIKTGAELTSLEKVGDKWRVEGTKDFWLKDEQVSAIQEALKTASEDTPELVSENADKKEDFGTHSEGTMISLLSGENKFEFFVGNTGPDFTSTYVSLPETSKTYLFKANLNSAFTRQDWLDKTIFDIDSEKISKIRFQYPSREFSIEKNEETWSGILPYKFSVDEDKIEDIVNMLSRLRATEIPAQTFEGTDLEKNLIIVQISGEEIDQTLMVGGSNLLEQDAETEDEVSELYYVKRGDSDNIYLISKEERDLLDQTIGGLR